jgi:hypothetical protein
VLGDAVRVVLGPALEEALGTGLLAEANYDC